MTRGRTNVTLTKDQAKKDAFSACYKTKNTRSFTSLHLVYCMAKKRYVEAGVVMEEGGAGG